MYRFKRVLFGVNASPFLLSATIKKHIENYRQQYPVTTDTLDTCLYVDDLITGSDDVNSALKLSIEANMIMKEANMNFRKWSSNSVELVNLWKEKGFELHPHHSENCDSSSIQKVLGIPWNAHEDSFTIDIKELLELNPSKPITKRFILHAAGKIYDPMGFVSPFVIRLKLILQELWRLKLSWDDELPPEILRLWSQWYSELPKLTVQIPRRIIPFSEGEVIDIQIHSFSDASQRGYGAAIYLRVKRKNQVSVNLITSKSRVAPLKKLSLPRLELLGALLAARLTKRSKENN